MSNDSVVFPTSYQEWRHCIEELGEIPLTRTYINGRLTELEDTSHAKTREFLKLYGNGHLQQTINWFRQAASELSG